MIVDVEAQWLSDIERQGRGYDYTEVLHGWYRALRRLGLDIDMVGPGADLSGYKLVIAPCLAMPDADLVARLAASEALLLFGPRSGAKTRDVTIPDSLPPGRLRDLLPVRVLAVETLRPDCPGEVVFDGKAYESTRWRESLDAGATDVLARYEDGGAALVRQGRAHYLATLADDGFLTALFAKLCDEAGVATTPVTGALRLRRRGDLVFGINYGETPVAAPAPADAAFVLGGRMIGARDLSIWRDEPQV
jgi:beta-galactosidase